MHYDTNHNNNNNTVLLKNIMEMSDMEHENIWN